MKPDYAFIVHARNRNDMSRKFPWMKILPRFILDFITMHMPPFAVSKITGLTNGRGEPSTGIVVGISMTAKQLIENKETALKRIIQAVKFAKSKGARFVGLGAMTASLSKGGNDVINLVPGVVVTTGRSYTVFNIVSYVEHFAQKWSIPKDKVRIGIVGAAGGIGSGVGILLAQRGYKNFLLIDLERKLHHLENHMVTIGKNGHDVKVDLAHQVSSISECHFVIAATSAPEVVIKSEDVSPGTIIINDAQPSDVSPEILEHRKDVLVIEGGVLHTETINCHFNFGLAEKHDIFSCLAETILLAHKEHNDHYSIGDFDSKFMDSLVVDAQKLGFNISTPQNDKGIISSSTADHFHKYVISRYNMS